MISYNLNSNKSINKSSDKKQIISSLNKLKDNINESRSQLDSLFTTKYFNKFWNNCDIFKYEKSVIAKLANNYNISNAWIKCYEMLNHFDLISKNKELSLFDNAAFPGSFILSVHHFTSTNNINLKWYGSSLIESNSQTSTELGDSYNLYRNYPDNWLMTDKNNGDILNYNNQLDFYNRLHNKIDLYTSDLGFDASSDYNNQELIQCYGNIGQILTGLLVLKKGGNFITKQFTYFEPITISLMYITSLYFEEFYICKPFSSREANSETYLVGKNFKGSDINDDNIQSLMEMIKKFDNVSKIEGYIYKIQPLISLEHIPSSFLNIILESSNEIYNNQINKINGDIKAVELFRKINVNNNFEIANNPEIQKYHDKYKDKLLNCYKENPIYPILSKNRLKMKNTFNQNLF